MELTIFLRGFSYTLAMYQASIDPGNTLIQHSSKQKNLALINQFHYGDSKIIACSHAKYIPLESVRFVVLFSYTKLPRHCQSAPGSD